MMMNARSLMLPLVTVLSTSMSVAGADLQYKIQPGQTIPYTVKVTVDAPDSTVTMAGVVTVTGKAASEDSLTLQYQGGLTKSEKTKASRGFGPPRFGGPPRRGGPSVMRSPFDQPDFPGLYSNTSNTLVISRSGQITSMKGNSQLPYLLGNLSLFFFEPLPAGDAQTWQDGSGISITSKSSPAFGPRFGPFSSGNEETVTGGGERVDYEVTETSRKLVSIKRIYSLTSPPAAGKESSYKMNGEGIWVFNQKMGVSESGDHKLHMEITRNNQTTKMPLTVSWHRMSDEEFTAHKQAVAKRQAELKERLAKQAAARKAAGPKPIDSFRKKNAMRQLTHKHWTAVWGKLESLNRIGPTPVVKEDMDMAMQVGILRGHSHEKVRASAEKVWAKWKGRFEELATEEQKAAVAAAVSDSEMEEENPFVVEQPGDDGKGIRTWRTGSGKFTLKAEFVRVEGDTVVLKDENKRTVRVPKTSLSSDDQKLVERLSKDL